MQWTEAHPVISLFVGLHSACKAGNQHKDPPVTIHAYRPWTHLYIHRILMLTTLTEFVAVYWHHHLCNRCNCHFYIKQYGRWDKWNHWILLSQIPYTGQCVQIFICSSMVDDQFCAKLNEQVNGWAEHLGNEMLWSIDLLQLLTKPSCMWLLNNALLSVLIYKCIR